MVPLVSLVLVLVSCGDESPLDIDNEICVEVIVGPDGLEVQPGEFRDSVVANVPADSLYVTPLGWLVRIIRCATDD
jgi:hypothetical protein